MKLLKVMYLPNRIVSHTILTMPQSAMNYAIVDLTLFALVVKYSYYYLLIYIMMLRCSLTFKDSYTQRQAIIQRASFLPTR